MTTPTTHRIKRTNRNGESWVEWCHLVGVALGRMISDEETLNVHELYELWDGGASHVDVAHMLDPNVDSAEAGRRVAEAVETGRYRIRIV